MDEEMPVVPDATLDQLLAPRAATDSGFPEDDVELPELGAKVRVRAVSRLEAIYIQSAKGVRDVERRTLALGMVRPAMTEDDVAKWQRSSVAKEIDAATTRIGQLSGMLEGSQKAAYKSVRDESDTGVRVLPSDETINDGGDTTADAE